MYKFSNGVVVFDEKTRDEYIKAGFKLIEDYNQKIEESKNEEDKSSNESINRVNKQFKKSTK